MSNSSALPDQYGFIQPADFADNQDCFNCELAYNNENLTDHFFASFVIHTAVVNEGHGALEADLGMKLEESRQREAYAPPKITDRHCPKEKIEVLWNHLWNPLVSFCVVALRSMTRAPTLCACVASV